MAHSRLEGYKRTTSYLFLLPALLLFAVVILYSALSGLAYSFTDWNGFGGKINFVGLKNYARMARDNVFSISVLNTLEITVVNVLVQNSLALFLAYILDGRIKGKKFFQALFFIPSILSSVVIGYMWMYILNPTVGSLHFLFRSVGFMEKIGFLSDPKLALGTVIGTIIWQYTGYKMIVFIGGMQSIPVELHEAAQIDGASGAARFWRITFPLLAPALTINVFLSLVNSITIFEHVYVMTNGGPGNATETISTMIYNTAFNANQLGYGTALSSVLFVVVMTIGVIQLKFMRSREVEF
ncbi:MAG: sugar ABC transporter permease [Spirochaetota bacterium]